MADSSVSITASGSTPIRVLTGLGAAVADQQVMTLADSAGNLLGTTGAPVPTALQAAIPAGTNTLGNVGAASSVVAAGSLAALNATYEGTIDCSIYSSVRVQVTGTWVGTITFQVSNDGATWVSRVLVAASTATNATTTTANGVWSGEIGGRYFRLSMTAYTSGTAVPTVVYSTAPASPMAVGLAGGTQVVGAIFVGATTPSTFATTSAASTNATLVKASAGQLQEVTVCNPTATAAYFKLYAKATAPTVGTDVPLGTWRVAATGSAGDSLTLSFGPNGKRVQNGIAWALTGAASSTDTTASVAGILISGTYI